MTYPEAAHGCAIAANAQVSFESLLQVAEFVNEPENCNALISRYDFVTKS